MKLAKLKGTGTQIEKAEKRRAHFLSLWQKRLSNIKERENVAANHTQLVEEAINYLSQIESAKYWLKIPTGSIHPRIEVAEIDMRLFDFIVKSQMEWLELHGIEPHFLAPQD